eukprot:7355079-Pyramimonas_sp.AAC.1
MITTACKSPTSIWTPPWAGRTYARLFAVFGVLSGLLIVAWVLSVGTSTFQRKARVGILSTAPSVPHPPRSQ